MQPRLVRVTAKSSSLGHCIELEWAEILQGLEIVHSWTGISVPVPSVSIRYRTEVKSYDSAEMMGRDLRIFESVLGSQHD